MNSAANSSATAISAQSVGRRGRECVPDGRDRQSGLQWGPMPDDDSGFNDLGVPKP